MDAVGQSPIVSHDHPGLPRKSPQYFPKNARIYAPDSPPQGLYYINSGRVKVMHSGTRRPVATIVYQDEMFGEAILVGSTSCEQSAIALDDVSLMVWTAEETEQSIVRSPEFGITLIRYFARKQASLKARIETMARLHLNDRIHVALLDFAADDGTPLMDGAIRVRAISQQTIAEFVGANRSVVAIQMNRLKRLGLVKYSRCYMHIFAAAIEAELRARGTAVVAGL